MKHPLCDPKPEVYLSDWISSRGSGQAMRVAEAIASGAVKRIEHVALVQLCDKSRIVLFETDLRTEEA
jgi:hypothetical protein